MSTPGLRSVTSAGGVDGTRLVYSEAGDLVLFDLEAREHREPPAGVNSAAFEWGASLAGKWLLFARGTEAGGDEVLLRNLVSSESRRLDRGTRNVYVQTGSVSVNFATWVKCRSLTQCALFRYDIAAKKTTRLPNPRRRAQYGPSGAADGTVYFAEASTYDCGSGLGIWRYSPGGSRKLVFAFPRGQDIADTQAVTNPDGTVSVYYDRYSCRTEASDIYRIDLTG